MQNISLASTKCHRVCFCFLSEHIAVLHHLRLLRWGSQSSSSSSATENNASWNIIFQPQILLGNSISLHFTNLSASINTNLLKFSPVWVEFTSSRVHLNMNVGAAYIMICHVFLSPCMLSSLLFPSKAYLLGNRGNSILKSSLHSLYHHARCLVSYCCICQTSYMVHSILFMIYIFDICTRKILKS